MSLLWKPWVHMTHSCNDDDAPLPIRPYLHVIVLQLATSNTTHSLYNLLQLPASEGLVTMTTWILKAVVLTLSQVHSCIACKTTFESTFITCAGWEGRTPKGPLQEVSLLSWRLHDHRRSEVMMLVETNKMQLLEHSTIITTTYAGL